MSNKQVGYHGNILKYGKHDFKLKMHFSTPQTVYFYQFFGCKGGGFHMHEKSMNPIKMSIYMQNSIVSGEEKLSIREESPQKRYSY